MATSTTRQEVSLDHPYKVLGVVTVIASLILIAFDLGVLESCGAGHGICLDWGTHRVGDAALVAFFILFLVGVLLIVYTGASTTVSTHTTRVPPEPERPASQPVVAFVSPAAPPVPGTTVNVTPPRGSS
jgi:hypothetical protein